MTQRMKALKSFRHPRQGRINPGQIFTAKPTEVAQLTVAKLAEVTDEVEAKAPAKRTYTRQAKRPVSALSTQDIKPRTRIAANKAKPAAKTGAKVTAAKRRYNRRDMQAR